MVGIKLVRHLPNLLTICRLIMVVPASWYLWTEQWLTTVILVAIASITDALDGVLARRFGWQSRFGEIADPVADKMLFGVLLVVATIQGIVPVWVTIVVLGRDLVILAGAGVYGALFRHVEIAPLYISKVNTAVQIIVLVLIFAAPLEIPVLTKVVNALLDPWGYLILIVFAVSSGTAYVLAWSQKARMAWQEKLEVAESQHD